ncbi:MAG TPA: NAD(P)-dependent alcohol dehydrogenase [Gemmatimonadales bacterium]|nr:NAD(P)-dependent alcohol dehydrogenase [Gemmatimonadales bacterium]
MIKSLGYAAPSATGALAPFPFERRKPGPRDVQIEIEYCGVCHSDLHTVRGEWEGTTWPAIPGHEILGRVTHVGGEVTRFKVGDTAAVGCMVDSCRSCSECADDLEQFCTSGAIFTYNSPDRHTGGVTFGGYSNRIVVDEAFTLRVPGNLDPAGAAPLLCAGITTYSPLRHWNVQPGQRVGIVGLGGLGHMALKLAHAMGASTALFTTSPGKAEDAKRLGADDVIISKDRMEMGRHRNSFDLVLDTVSVAHDLDAYIALLKRDGALVLLGVPPQPNAGPSAFNLIFGRRKVSGSLIGGIRETQEMLDFCGEHDITSDVEVIPIQYINEAYERMLQSDVKYRFVIDMASLAQDEAR